jgi:hypothetical protein
LLRARPLATVGGSAQGTDIFGCAGGTINLFFFERDSALKGSCKGHRHIDIQVKRIYEFSGMGVVVHA